MQRIELWEKVVNEFTDDEEYLIDLGVPVERTHSYRRINPLVSEITPEEIEGVDDECLIIFSGGYKCRVKINYDELCIKLNDLENNYLEEE